VQTIPTKSRDYKTRKVRSRNLFQIAKSKKMKIAIKGRKPRKEREGVIKTKTLVGRKRQRWSNLFQRLELVL
jgi:hypothetical protein